MAITLDGTTGITAPGVTDTGNLSVTGTSTLTGAVSQTSSSTAASFIPTGSTVPANGMYLSAANTLNFATNTTNQVSISSGGIVTGTAGNLMLVQGTAQASTSGTSIAFTGIPTWVKRITVMLNGVSVTGSSYVLVQIGSGSTTTSGYVGSGTNTGTGSAASNYTVSYTNAFGVSGSSPGTGSYNIIGTLANISGNNWIWSCVGNDSGSAVGLTGAGKIALGGVLDRVVFAASTSSSTMSGTDTFDAGSINIQYE